MARSKIEPGEEYERLRMTHTLAADRDAVALYGFRPGERTWWKPWTWNAGQWELIEIYTPLRPTRRARGDGEVGDRE